MKKIFILLITLFLSICFSTFSSKNVLAQGIDDEQIINRDFSLNDNFSPDKVIVVLKNCVSRHLRDYSISDFPNIDCEKVIDLTENIKEMFRMIEKDDYSFITSENDIRKRLDINNYHQILSITLNEKTKENVLNSINILKNNGDIYIVEPSFYISECNSPTEWSHLTSNERWGLNKIQMPNAWDTYTSSEDIRVGVIDSGILFNHPDLSDNIYKDNLGHIIAFDCTSDDYLVLDDSQYTPVFDHGTHVAGIIGAVGNNNCPAIGVCWSTKLVSLRIKDNFGNENTFAERIIKAINCATATGIEILNLSYSSNSYGSIYAAIGNYPGLFVCSAGNDGANVDSVDIYPSKFALKNMITVGNSDRNDNKADNSNYGVTSVDLFAPGVNIYSTILNNDYGTDSGTSMAAPFVAGVAAIILGNNPTLTPQEVKSIIMDNVDILDSLAGYCVSNGRLNAYKAFNAGVTPKTLTGDVNGDGKEDLIVVKKSLSNYEINVFKGYNDFTFDNAPTLTSTSILYKYDEDILSGDFNNDGRTDILIHSKEYITSKRKIYVLLGNSNSEFTIYSYIDDNNYYNPIENPYKCIVADQNGDNYDDFIVVYKKVNGKIDIIVYRGDYLINPPTDLVIAPYTSPYDYHIYDLVFKGDFNGDGKDDILIHSFKGTTNKRRLYIYKSENNSTFTPTFLDSVKSYVPNVNPSYFEVGNTNFDGKDDFIVYYKNSNGYKEAITYLGTATSPYLVDTGNNYSLTSTDSFSITSPFFYADSDGNGLNDIITIEYDGFHKREIVVHKANNNYYFNSSTEVFNSNYYEYPLTDVKRCYMMRVNGDGRYDVVIVKKNSYGNMAVYVYQRSYTGYVEAVLTSTSIHYYV